MMNMIREESDKLITVDYSEYPENFMIKLLEGQRYLFKYGDSITEFIAKTKGPNKNFGKLTYGDYEVNLDSCVYYNKTEPILIHFNGKDYIWICEEGSDGNLISASFYGFLPNNSVVSDNGIIHINIGDKILDPSDFTMLKSVDCFGAANTKIHYRINETGKPEEIQTQEEFYYIETPDSKELLRLENDIHTWVFDDANSDIPAIETLSAGTLFYRLRIPKNEESGYTDGILEDNRVFRVIEEYKFSEPVSYQVMKDMDGKKFSYSFVK